MKIKPSEGNQTFCMAPWSHTYLSPQSERRLCCASREKAEWATQYLDSEGANANSKYNPGTLEDHWNSEYMKGIRRDLMAGKEIPQCDVCNQKLLNLSIYRDYFTKTLFPHKIDEAFEKLERNIKGGKGDILVLQLESLDGKNKKNFYKIYRKKYKL